MQGLRIVIITVALIPPPRVAFAEPPGLPATFQEIELRAEADRTIVALTVCAANRFSCAMRIDPLREAVLRDDLGNEYRPLGFLDEKDTLTGNFGGGLINPEKRSGQLVFPPLREGVRTVAFILPVSRQRTLLQIVFMQLLGDVFTLSKTWNVEPSRVE